LRDIVYGVISKELGIVLSKNYDVPVLAVGNVIGFYNQWLVSEKV